jgi:hypothetical protein
MVDFRIGPDPNNPDAPDQKGIPERRVQVIYRESDRIIVSIAYYNVGGQHFENADLRELLALNRGRVPGRLVSHLYGKYGDENFEVCSASQYGLEKKSAKEDSGTAYSGDQGP